jgi:hypothetical protein
LRRDAGRYDKPQAPAIEGPKPKDEFVSFKEGG